MVPPDALATDLRLIEWPTTEREAATFARPFVDIDELRTWPAPHRYVHGGFLENATRFSFYFPDETAYEGRFFQHVTPVPQSENLAQQATGEADRVGFAAESGAYYVETNGGGPDLPMPGSGIDPTIAAYRANAASARFSRIVATRIYGDHRPFGYLYGGSGGAYRTIGAAENTTDVWDGFVPYVPGSPMAIPNMFTVRMHAQRILRERFPEIVDAYDVGGDPAELDLTPEQRAALDEVTRMGFSPRSWFGWRTMGMHAFSVLYPGVMMADPGYADDYWRVPGYLGADPSSSVHSDRMQVAAAVRELVREAAAGGGITAIQGGVDESFAHDLARGADLTGVRLDVQPTGWALGAELTVRTGASAGATIRLSSVDGDLAVIEPGQQAEILAGLAEGDEVVVDNSNFLAAQTYHRHQVPDESYVGWEQFRDADGAAVYPQRPYLIGPMFTANASGAVPTGALAGESKMIAVACMLDREALPWQADWYRSQVQQHLGDAAGRRFRLWYVDNALHGDDEEQEFPTRTVSYLGALHTALRQLASWVETGREPSDSTDYVIADSQIRVAATAPERRGIQPTVAVRVNGGTATSVAVGDPVRVEVEAHAAVGLLVEVARDLAGSGSLAKPEPVEPTVELFEETSLTFSEPGTYFVAARITAQTDGDPSARFARVHNVARARVVVTA